MLGSKLAGVTRGCGLTAIKPYCRIFCATSPELPFGRQSLRGELVTTTKLDPASAKLRSANPHCNLCKQLEDLLARRLRLWIYL